MAKAYTIGIDYGTNSVRALVVDCADGREVGTSVFDYPSGDQGILLDPKDPHLARQNPADYVAGLEASVNGALAAAEKQTGFSRADVIGIGVDTTGSTPIPVDAKSRPLALDPRWKANLAAQAWLWKDHTGAEEAAAITRIAAEHAPQYLAPIGGTYSSEWFWSKIWHCLKEAPGRLRRRPQLGGARRLRPGGPGRHRRSREDPALRLRRRPQGDVLRRLGRPAVEGLPEAPRPEAGRPARPALREGVRGGPAGGHAVEGVGREARPPRGHPDRDGGLRRALRRGRLRRPRRARSSRSSAPRPATAPWPRRRRRSRTCPASAGS